MYGFQPKHARGSKPMQKLADGGLVHSLTGMLGMRPKTREELLAADAKAQARNQEAAARVAARNAAAAPAPAPAPAAAPAPQSAITDYSGMSAMQRREKEQGLKDGGTVKPHGFKVGGMIRGPGTGTSDSIEAKKKPGTFIMPADSTEAFGPDALEELGEADGGGEELDEDSAMSDDDEAAEGEAVPVRLSNGEFEFTPDQVQALGEAVLTVMRDATHQPASHSKAGMPTAAGFAPGQFFADGGSVKDEERARRQAQIPTGSNVPVPPADGSGSTELQRNVNNGLNALGGMGVVASVPLRAGQAAKSVASGAPALAAPARAAAPAADFVAGAGSNATAYANTIPRIGNAPTPALPAVNAALQQGAQANALSAAARTAAGAGAAATGASNAQPAETPAASPSQPIQPAQPSSEYGRQMGAVGNALADGAAWLGKTIVSAPGYGFSAPDAAASKQRMAAGTSAAAGGRGVVNPAAVVPAAPSVPSPGYTASEQPAPTPAPAAAQPLASGVPSAQNDAAAQAMSERQAAAGFVPGGAAPSTQVTAPVVRNSTNDWAARNDLRNLQVSASSITNTPQWSRGTTTNWRGQQVGGQADQDGNVAAYLSALKNDQALQQAQPAMEQAAMRETGANQRTAVQDAGATTRAGMQEQGALAREVNRNAIAQGDLGLRREAQGFKTRAAAQLEALQNAYTAEKNPAKQAEIARQIREIQGKEQPARYKVAAGGQQVDASGVAYKVPDRVFNEQTGQFVDGGNSKPAQPYPDGTRLQGKDGKFYVVKNGTPVPE